MSKKLLHETALERRLVCDGAMGTQLMLAGLEQGGCGEMWNLTHADRVLEIQRRYVEAGTDCLITNTFGGSRIMLKRHGHADDLRAINQAGVRIAREALAGGPGLCSATSGRWARFWSLTAICRRTRRARLTRNRRGRWSRRARTPSSLKHRRRSTKSASRLTPRRPRARRASSRRWRMICRRTKRFT